MSYHILYLLKINPSGRVPIQDTQSLNKIICGWVDLTSLSIKK